MDDEETTSGNVFLAGEAEPVEEPGLAGADGEDAGGPGESSEPHAVDRSEAPAWEEPPRRWLYVRRGIAIAPLGAVLLVLAIIVGGGGQGSKEAYPAVGPSADRTAELAERHRRDAAKRSRRGEARRAQADGRNEARKVSERHEEEQADEERLRPQAPAPVVPAPASPAPKPGGPAPGPPLVVPDGGGGAKPASPDDVRREFGQP